jgi:hypothetical protein
MLGWGATGCKAATSRLRRGGAAVNDGRWRSGNGEASTLTLTSGGEALTATGSWLEGTGGRRAAGGDSWRGGGEARESIKYASKHKNHEESMVELGGQIDPTRPWARKNKHAPACFNHRIRLH